MTRALVTGCSSGIGFATAIRLAQEGYDVVAAMRRPERDAGRLLEAAERAGVSLRVAQLDVDDPGSVETAFAAAGDIDVLVNNAGIFQLDSVEETPPDEWRAMFETNYFGAVRCVQRVLPHMREQGSGCIINVSSAGAVSCPPASGAYAASKAALEATSMVLAAEGRPHGIRVIVMETGGVRTPILGKLKAPSKHSPYAATTQNTFHFLRAMLGELSDPTEIAEAIVRAIRDEGQPQFMVHAGKGSQEISHLRSLHDAAGWIELFASPPTQFAERLTEMTEQS